MLPQLSPYKSDVIPVVLGSRVRDCGDGYRTGCGPKRYTRTPPLDHDIPEALDIAGGRVLRSLYKQHRRGMLHPGAVQENVSAPDSLVSSPKIISSQASTCGTQDEPTDESNPLRRPPSYTLTRHDGERPPFTGASPRRCTTEQTAAEAQF